MKKFLSVLLAFMFVIPCAVLFGACGTTEEQPKLVIEQLQDVYYINEELNLEGAVLKYDNEGENAYVEITDEMIRGFSSKTAGQKTMYVVYQGISYSFNYTVLNLSGSTFEATKKYKYEENVAVDVETYTNGEYTFVFNKNGTFNSTLSDHEQRGNYIILTNGNIKLTYTELGTIKTIVFVKKSKNTYEVDTNNDGEIMVYELKIN